MKTKGIIIDKKDYDRLIEIEKKFDKKVKENKESFEKGLKEAIKGNLVKILWVKDKFYADTMQCDLEEENLPRFIRREDADIVEKTSSASYNREDVIKDHDYEKDPLSLIDKWENAYQEEIIGKQRKTIRNLWWAFGLMFAAWVILLIKSFM